MMLGVAEAAGWGQQSGRGAPRLPCRSGSASTAREGLMLPRVLSVGHCALEEPCSVRPVEPTIR